MSVKFGPAGNSESFSAKYKSSLDAPAWLAGLGLDCYEYQCGKGVNVGEETARKLGEKARQAGISLSLHAPYFINLANAETVDKTASYVLAACRAADWMGATRVVIHTGAVMKRPRAQAQAVAMTVLPQIITRCDDAGYGHITLCPETMGKLNQLGDLDEVLELCTLDERLLPCVDFGHLYARSLGAEEGPEAVFRMLERMKEVLGEERASRFHSHFSRIEFTVNGGEKCHRTFADNGGFGPDPIPLMAELARRGWSPTIICESAGTQAEDALAMKAAYRRFLAETEEETVFPTLE